MSPYGDKGPTSAGFFFGDHVRSWPKAVVLGERFGERTSTTAYERIADVTSSCAAPPRGGGYRPTAAIAGKSQDLLPHRAAIRRLAAGQRLSKARGVGFVRAGEPLIVD